MPRKVAQSRVCVACDQIAKPSATVIDDKPLVLEVDLLHAIDSLYNDHLRPYGRLIRKRLGEDAEVKGTGAVDGNLGRLRAACEGSHKIRVEAEADGEWSAVLVGRSFDFVDFYSHNDPYPEDMWRAAQDYFEVMERENGSLPGGRYATALALMKLDLPFLSTYSLGQLCHIVELAMTTRKLLGYLEGAIVPYACSHSRVKDSAAERRVGNGNASQQLPLATWEVARTCLREILASATRKGKASVPLSTLKRLYRSRFHTELSETALGYTKLTELLQDPRIADLCTVRLLEQGYVLTPGNSYAEMQLLQHFHRQAEQQQQQYGSGKQQWSDMDEPLRIDDASQPSHELWTPEKWKSLTASNFSKDGCIGSAVQNTFIHFKEPRDRRRSKSVPKDMGSRRCALESSCHSLAFMPRSTQEVSLEKESQVLSSSSSTRSLFSSSADWNCSIDLDLALEESGNVGIASGSFCDDPITYDDLASCMTFCVEGSTNLECQMEVCSTHFPLFLPSPAVTASPWGTPIPHGGWVPATAESCNSSLNFASCPALCMVSLNEQIIVTEQAKPSGSDAKMHSPVLTASPQWTPRLDIEVPCEEPKTVLRLVDLL
jgi:hypothetical protein